jgi:hypothetical protein
MFASNHVKTWVGRLIQTRTLDLSGQAVPVTDALDDLLEPVGLVGRDVNAFD